jgi:hypothetical protein
VEIALNIIFWITVTVYPGMVLFVVVLVCINIYKIKTAPNMENLPRILDSFMSAKANRNTGRNFVDLIALNFFVVFKTNNHSKDFDEERHLRDFRKNNTPEHSAALRRIGEIYGQHFV